MTLSPASVRNVMADLEQLGLVYAQHTSAGRLPTERGLRFFVDALMQVGDLTEGDRQAIEAQVAAAGTSKSVDAVLGEASALLSGLTRAAGVVLAWYMYMTAPVRPDAIGQARTPVHAFLLNAWYVDWLYDRVFVRPLFALCAFFARFDLGVIDGLVNLTGRLVELWSVGTRRLQTGYVVNYALTMLAGAVALVGFLLTR